MGRVSSWLFLAALLRGREGDRKKNYNSDMKNEMQGKETGKLS